MQSASHVVLPVLIATLIGPTVVEGWCQPFAAFGQPVPSSLRTVVGSRAATAAVLSEGGSAGAGVEGADADHEDAVPRPIRAVLAVLAMAAVVLASVPSAVHAETSVDVFFGQGCFWHVQHDIARKEMRDLERDGSSVTALAGYAGGTQVGDKGRVCYHNLAMAPDYGNMGHTEVVSVQLPESKVRDFARAYFDAADAYRFGRADPQDRGTEYRSAVGVPGGIDGTLFKQVEEANAGRLQLVRGEGNDADTVGTKKVWIYDSNKFPFYQGEVYHQFHDDMAERYSDSYHKLKESLLSRGALKRVGCPEIGF